MTIHCTLVSDTYLPSTYLPSCLTLLLILNHLPIGAIFDEFTKGSSGVDTVLNGPDQSQYQIDTTIIIIRGIILLNITTYI